SLPNGTVQTTQNSGASWAATTGSPNAVINDWTAIPMVGPLGASSNGSGQAVVYRGVMSGASWTQSTPFGTGVATSIASGGGSSPNAIAFVAVNGSGGGVFRSSNLGTATFTFATTNFPQTQVLSVQTALSTIGTAATTRVYAGTNGQGAGVYRSND